MGEFLWGHVARAENHVRRVIERPVAMQQSTIGLERESARPWYDMGLLSSFGKERADALKRENTRAYQEHLFAMFGLPFRGEDYVFGYAPRAVDRRVVGIEMRADARWQWKRWGRYPELIERLQAAGTEVRVFLAHPPWLSSRLPIQISFNLVARSQSSFESLPGEVFGDTLSSYREFFMNHHRTIIAVLVASTSASALGIELVSPRIVGSSTHVAGRSRILPASSDSLLLLGLVYPGNFGLAAFGDTDHDGYQEMFSAVNDFEATNLRAVEEQGDGVYHDVFALETDFAPYVIGDLDQDGKSEIVGQIGSCIEILESQNAMSHPTVTSWFSPPLSNIVGCSNIGDTDRDGKMEIIHSINPSRLIIFENQGDNTFVQKFFDAGPFQDQGRKLIADFDGDGLLEIAVSGHQGHVLVYESPADDVWMCIFKDSTGLDNAYGIGGGVDSDGNGLLELFVVGDGWVEELGRRVRTIYVYESPCNNCFTRVATMEFDDGHIGGLSNAVATTNLDNVGRPEVVLSVFRQLNVYRAVAPGQWIMTVAAIDPHPGGIRTSVYAHDVNRNGLPEIFWVPETNINQSTLVLEHPGVSPTDAGTSDILRLARLDVTPNPARGRASITLVGPPLSARSMSVFDAAGRLVVRQPLPPETVRQFLWSSLPSRPGMYFLRAEDAIGRTLATGRATIVR